MNSSRRTLVVTAACLALGILLSACGNTGTRKPVLQGDNTQEVNFSGSWEMDYSRSDNSQEQLDLLVRELNRAAQRRAQGNMYQGPGGAMVIGGAGADSGASILGLVRMADMITQSPLLEIEQDKHKIRAKREDNFDLTCEFYPGQYSKVETPFGTEICGWNGHQLVFKLQLPEGLDILHVMTLGAAGQKLNIATTVVSSQVSFPFTLNRVYNRFEAGASEFTCEMTLTRGRVCTTKTR